MTEMEEAYDAGFVDAAEVRDACAAALEKRIKTLERRCEWFRRALIGAAVVATVAIRGPFLNWLRVWVSQ